MDASISTIHTPG